MNIKPFLLLALWLCAAFPALAQKPFVEGTINYKITLRTADHKSYNGSYLFTFKEGCIKKELKLNDGYQDVVIINCTNNTVYSLKTKNGKKYAIQLSMDEIKHRQKLYSGFVLHENFGETRMVAGIPVTKGSITFRDGSTTDLFFTSEWYPDQGITFERYPNAHFLPLIFDYKDENGVLTHMEAEKVSVSPVENSTFRIPNDYKIIAHDEYLLLCK